MFGSDFEGKLALVTGASTGIGAAVAAALAARGAKVAVHYNRSAGAAEDLVRAIEAAGGSAVLVRGDLTERGEPARVVAEAAARLGGLDILINNAGAMIRRAPLSEVDDALIDSVFDLNVRSVIATSQAAVPFFDQRGGGTIINVGSVAGMDGGGAGSMMSASSKAFIHNLTRPLARALGAKNIRVNTVSPGAINTPFHVATPKDRMEAMKKSIHLGGRLGEPEDCVGTFLYLASDRMSGYVTGQNIHVNGGQFMP